MLNYAEVWQRELLDTVIQGSLTSPFITENVRFVDAKTFHFTTLKTSGFKDHSRGGGWNKGNFSQTDHPYTLDHDRDVQFFIDKADIDETNATASAEKIAAQFEKTQAVPEVDARFYEQVSKAAINSGNAAAKALNTYTKDTIISDIKGAIDKVRRYRNSLIVYVRTELMSLIEVALGEKARIQWTSVSDLEFSIETRVAYIDGVPIMEVIDVDRFATKFDYQSEEGEDGGFKISTTATTGSTDTPWQKLAGKQINVLVASTETALTVHKIVSIYFRSPEEHTEGDGYLYQHRDAWDTFVFPNGKDGKIDSVYVQYAA